jgi:hypothetical protein
MNRAKAFKQATIIKNPMNIEMFFSMSKLKENFLIIGLSVPLFVIIPKENISN